ncbi:hypothetical protein [Legionella shakespearei]|nr:hypothetical protein [Legionella shakespearei]
MKPLDYRSYRSQRVNYVIYTSQQDTKKFAHISQTTPDSRAIMGLFLATIREYRENVLEGLNRAECISVINELNVQLFDFMNQLIQNDKEGTRTHELEEFIAVVRKAQGFTPEKTEKNNMNPYHHHF